MDLSIIIVNWNSKEYLRKCVSSILAGTRGLEFEIIVIDSASFDGCTEMLQGEFPQVRFIQSRENLGFAKSNNLAFKSAVGESVLFLNPDTEIVGPAINVLHSALKLLPDAGVVGGKLLNSDGTVQTSCVQAFPTILNQLLSAEALRRLTPKARLWGIRAIFENGGKPSAVDMISGACLMMRRSVFENIGQFSSDYFMYAEDVDLCYKCRKLGFNNYYFSEAVVVHHGGGSSQQARSNFSDIMLVESNRQFFNKWRGGIYSGCYRLMLSGSALIRVALLLILSPVLLVKSGVSRWKASCSKWFAVLNWGLGLSGWIRQYRRTEEATII
jgi:GT2 family glycosyltransferase